MRGITIAQKKLIDEALDCGALEFGEFVLKSGRKSPFFFNLGKFVSGKQLRKIAEAYGDTIYRGLQDGTIKDFDVLFGPAYKGIPLAATTAVYLSEHHGIEVKYCANRKEVKDHGDKGGLLGAKLKDGDRVLIIEDVTTSGASIAEVMPAIHAQGAIQVVGEVVALDRCERASDDNPKFALDVIAETYGFSVTPIVRMTDVVSYLRNHTHVISNEMYAKIQEYYEEHGGEA